jgi:hypothetical protein
MKAFFADENQIKRDAIAVRQLDAPRQQVSARNVNILCAE